MRLITVLQLQPNSPPLSATWKLLLLMLEGEPLPISLNSVRATLAA